VHDKDVDILLDLIVIVVIILFMLLGYRRGLIKMVFRLVSFILAIVLAILLFPVVAQWLRGTFIYSGLKEYIRRTMGLEELVYSHATEIFTNLPIPDMLQNMLAENHTPSMIELLSVNANNVGEFIAAYIAGLVVNIIAIVLVFILVRVILGIISNLLDIVKKLPIIGSFNSLGGTIAGAFQGILVIWIILALATLFFLNPDRPEFLNMLESSWLAYWFFENNPILSSLMNIK